MSRELIIIILLISFLFSKTVFLQNKSKNLLIEKKSKIEIEIELANKLLNDTKLKEENSLSELNLIKKKIESRNSLIVALNSEISIIDKKINTYTRQIESLEIELKKVKEEYAGLIYHTFKNRNSEISFMYFLASKSINQLYSRYIYLQQYKEYRKKQVNLITALDNEIEKEIELLTEAKEEKVDIINKKLYERSNLIGESREKDVLIKNLKTQEEKLIDEIKSKKKIAIKLDKEIENIITKEKGDKKIVDLTPEQKLVSLDFEKNKGRLPWPTEKGIVTSKFGENEHPVIKEIKVRNNGIDISTTENSKVRAVFDGEIKKVFSIKGANSTVIIQHGKYFSVYHNIINVFVKAGDKVKTKDIIGIVYTDKKTGVSIIHLEIWKELIKENPEIWLSK